MSEKGSWSPTATAIAIGLVLSVTLGPLAANNEQRARSEAATSCGFTKTRGYAYSVNCSNSAIKVVVEITGLPDRHFCSRPLSVTDLGTAAFVRGVRVVGNC